MSLIVTEFQSLCVKGWNLFELTSYCILCHLTKSQQSQTSFCYPMQQIYNLEKGTICNKKTLSTVLSGKCTEHSKFYTVHYTKIFLFFQEM